MISQHKAQVQEVRKKDREEMERELFEIRRSTGKDLRLHCLLFMEYHLQDIRLIWNLSEVRASAECDET